MPSVDPRVLRGFRDTLPRDMLLCQRMFEALEGVFRKYGFLPLMTPALEYSDILLGKYGDEGDSLLYRFRDNGDRDVSLRYDLTVPLARVVAQYPDLPKPFRRYQIAPVWRADRPARGRFREFIQCDGDIIGSDEQVADAEVIQLGAEMLLSLGVKNFRVNVNNRKILTGLLDIVGIPPGAKELGVLRTVDKLPKIGLEATRELLARENSLDGGQIDTIFDFLRITGSPEAVLTELRSFFPPQGVGSQGVAELTEVFAILEAVNLSQKLAIDLSIARGLNYYTGTIYEAFLNDLPGFGAVMSGGRYDGLIGTFAKEDLPGVGISLGIDRLLAGLRELDLLSEEGPPALVLVTLFDGTSAARSARVAQAIRQAGVACELYPQAVRLKKQLRYAERSGKRLAVIVGPDEAARGVAQVKDLDRDLEERRQEEISLEGLGEALRQKLQI